MNKKLKDMKGDELDNLMKDLKHKKSPKYIFLIFKCVLKQLTLGVLPILDCKLEGLRVRLSSSIF